MAAPPSSTSATLAAGPHAASRRTSTLQTRHLLWPGRADGAPPEPWRAEFHLGQLSCRPVRCVEEDLDTPNPHDYFNQLAQPTGKQARWNPLSIHQPQKSRLESRLFFNA